MYLEAERERGCMGYAGRKSSFEEVGWGEGLSGWREIRLSVRFKETCPVGLKQVKICFKCHCWPKICRVQEYNAGALSQESRNSEDEP